jgi:hypothetical protein
VLNYTIVDQTLTTTHASGANLGFSLSVNEAYKLVLSRFDTDYQEDDSGILTVLSK